MLAAAGFDPDLDRARLDQVELVALVALVDDDLAGRAALLLQARGQGLLLVAGELPEPGHARDHVLGGLALARQLLQRQPLRPAAARHQVLLGDLALLPVQALVGGLEGVAGEEVPGLGRQVFVHLVQHARRNAPGAVDDPGRALEPLLAGGAVQPDRPGRARS